jgi:hypothetical protein
MPRIIAFAAANQGILKTVNVVTSLTGYSPGSIKTSLQETAAQAGGNPNTQPTVMASASLTPGLPTIFVSGYTAPS